MNDVRLLKNARLKNVPISQNESYNFSSRYTLSIYPLDAICTFIPKNACSSLRYSIAIANGFIKDLNDIKWIHSNNQTFIATQRELALSKYTFVVLRCPFTRVASCFIDKFVGRKLKFNDSSGRKISVNFHDFLTIVKSQTQSDRDEHWRNQSDFLHFEKYDQYFSLESFSNATNALEDKGFKVHDVRSVVKHDLSGFKRVEGDFSKMRDVDLKIMKDQGMVPSYKSMFGAQEISLVNEIYSDDIELYKSHFGDRNLLFK
jgi:hypothetical protein